MIHVHKKAEPVIIFKVSLARNSFTTITSNDICVFIEDDDEDYLLKKVKDEFDHAFDGYYFFGSDDEIKEIFDKAIKIHAIRLLARDRK